MRRRGRLSPLHTYVSSSGSSSSRIDMFLLSPGLRVHTYSIRVVHFSDHHMETVSLVWGKPITVAKGLQMNTSHLQDPQIARRYLEWVSLKQLFDSPVEWWEMVKERVQGYFRAVGRRKAKERKAAFERHNAALQRLSLLQHRAWMLVATSHKLGKASPPSTRKAEKTYFPLQTPGPRGG